MHTTELRWLVGPHVQGRFQHWVGFSGPLLLLGLHACGPLDVADGEDVDGASDELESSVPAPWRTSDVGAPALEGSAVSSNEGYTVQGGGADIWGRSDQFRFVYQPLTGDGQLTARVDSLSPTHAWAKAGIMMRDGLAPDARHAFIAVTPEHGAAFQRRPVAGDASVSSSAGAGASFVRLVRAKDVFTGLVSADGRTWTKVGTATIRMSASIQVGMAVTSHNANAVTTARFSWLALGRAPPAPGPIGRGVKWNPGEYIALFPGGLPGGHLNEFRNEPNIKGVHITLFWNWFEPGVLGQYNFSAIDAALNSLRPYGKHLLVELKARTQACVPQYMYGPLPGTAPFFGGRVATLQADGTYKGCTAKLWIPAVMDRYIAAIQAIGARYDGDPLFEGITTSEVMTGQWWSRDEHWTQEGATAQLIRLMEAAPVAMPHTIFWLSATWGRGEVAQLFAAAERLGLGIGGTDAMPMPATGGTDGHRLNPAYHGKIPLAIKSEAGAIVRHLQQKTVTMRDVYDFAIYDSSPGLRVNHMIWQSYTAPQQPGYNFGEILPLIRSERFPNTSCPASIMIHRGGCN